MFAKKLIAVVRIDSGVFGYQKTKSSNVLKRFLLREMLNVMK